MPENNPEGYGPTRNQRGSLREVNQTLLQQNTILTDVVSRVSNTNDILRKSLDAEAKRLSMEKLKGLEASREAGRGGPGVFGRMGQTLAGAGSSAAGGLRGLLGNIGSFLTPAALAALPGILAATLLKRGIPALAVGVFADEIADFLLGPNAEKELKDQVARAIQGGAIGSLLGKKFALIGAAAGFLIDDEVAAQMKELGISFAQLFRLDVENMEDLKGVMVSIGNFLRNTLKSGLQGINHLLNGELKAFLFGENGEGGHLLATLGTLAGLGFIFSPRATFSIMGGLLKGTLSTVIRGIGILWKGVPAVLAALGFLGTNIMTSKPGGPRTGVPLTSTTSRASRGVGALRFVRGVGLVGAAFLGGPVGTIITVAAIAGIAGEAFMQTEMYAQLAKEQKEREEASPAFQNVLQAQLDAGATEEEARIAARLFTSAGQGQDYTLDGKAGAGKSNVPSVLGAEIGGTTFMAKLASLEAIEKSTGNPEKFSKSPIGQELAAMRAELVAEASRKEMASQQERFKYDTFNERTERITPGQQALDFAKIQEEANAMEGVESNAFQYVEAPTTVNNNGYNAYSMSQSGASTQDVVDTWVEGNRSAPR